MTLAKIIDILKMIALKHPNVNSAYEGNIYDILNGKPDNKYASVVVTQQSHTTDETYDHYGFVIFYVDRLIDDLEENRVQIQSIGKSMLGNIITAFCNEFEAECDNIIYQPFTQRFTDETAGVYCTITIDIIKDAYCAERYWDESWSAPIISIKNVDMSITLTENGHYVLDYDPTTYTGIGRVDIDVEFNTEPYYNDGYANGYNNGVSEQKSKLETISITENGVYSNEDGYNHIEVNVPDLNGSYEDGYNQGYAEGEQVSYGKGYEQGQTDIAANARVLEVTENGNYLSKFSDPIIPPLVTGMYDDGSGFYNYATISGSVFDTGIPAAQDAKIELWWKNTDESYRRYGTILGGQTFEGYIFKFAEYETNTYRIEYGNYKLGKLFEHNFTYDMTSQWNHIIFSKKDGLYVNGELICNVQGEEWAKDEIVPNFWINAPYLEEVYNNADGTFGMIKIDDVVIIPTADGFLNVNTGNLLGIVQDGEYTYTENLPKYGEGELYKTINVNVVPKVNIAKSGVKFGYSTFNEIPEWFDSDGITDFADMFYYCSNLTTIPEMDTSNATNMNRMFYNCSITTIPKLDTSNVTNMSYMFGYCGELQTIPQLDTSNVTTMSNMFYNCSRITTIPQLNTSNVNNMSYMFYNCSSLTSIPQLNTSNVNNMERMFYGCGNLTTIPQLDVSKVTNISNYFRSGGGNVTDVGGWKNLKIDWNDNYGLVLCPKLTYQSCINILNGLYDFVGNGESTTKTLKVHQNFLTTVGDEISIGTNKGWIITA